jgi:hypothetical protein
MSSTKTMGRRDVLRRTLVVIAAAPVMAPLLASCGGGEPSCSSGGLAPAQLATRSTLHYVEHGTDPARRCSGCQLFAGSADACGTCTVIPGSINPRGSCDAFAARA